MAVFEPITSVLAIAAIAVVISTIPFAMAAISYRDRDNGLAYLLLVSGVGIWNAMFVAQLLSMEPLIQAFFLALSVVGAVLAGLGFLLFATTARSTSDYLSHRGVYGTAGVLGGLDIVLAVTAPVHQVYWRLLPPDTTAISFAAVEPGIGYWLHTGLLVLLFGVGAALFLDARQGSIGDIYSLAYVVAGVGTAFAVIWSNAMAPGGVGVASIIAVSLTAVGWLQASRGEPLAWIRGGVG